MFASHSRRCFLDLADSWFTSRPSTAYGSSPELQGSPPPSTPASEKMRKGKRVACGGRQATAGGRRPETLDGLRAREEENSSKQERSKPRGSVWGATMLVLTIDQVPLVRAKQWPTCRCTERSGSENAGIATAIICLDNNVVMDDVVDLHDMAS
jgi:hypothetical protein